MKTIDEYLKLNDNEKNSSLLSEIQELKDYYYNNKDFINYYKSLLFLIEIYNNEEKYDDSLEICNHLDSLISKNDFPHEYKTLLDQYVYIYITKQYYQRALNYCLKKKEFIDVKNNSEVNRWYLELAYIHDAIGEKHEALMKLTSILENNPDDVTKAFCLNNITKLFVDEGSLEEAKIYLEQCLEFVKKINDIEGINYCEYLRGKIYRLEKNYREAYRLFDNMFKNITKLEADNFSYLNEFIYLLNEMEEYSYGITISNKFYDEVNNSYDLQNKLIFLKNYLKLNVALSNMKRLKTSRVEPIDLLNKINHLEEEINENKNIKSNEIRDDELSFELKILAENDMNKLQENIDSILFSTSSGDIRKFLTDFCDSLCDKIPMQDVLIALFNKNTKSIIPSIPTDTSTINVFNYKSNRLYERNYNYTDLENTLLEKLISSDDKNGIALDINDLNSEMINYIDIVTKKEYDHLNIKYVYALPLINNEALYGAIIFSSVNNNILSTHNVMALKIIKNLLEINLINLLYTDSIITQEGILKSTTKQLKLGSFYQVPEKKVIIISSVLKELLNVKKSELLEKDYNNLIAKGDLNVYLKKYDKIKNKEDYSLDYHLVIEDKSILVHEQATPFITPKDEVYYCGTIECVEINEAIIKEIDSQKLQNTDKLVPRLETLRKSSFTSLVYKFNGLSKLDMESQNKTISYLFDQFKNSFSDFVYYSNEKFHIIKGLKEKEVQKLNTIFLKSISKLDISFSYTLIDYPKVLVRLDDYFDVSNYIFENTNDSFIPFTNEVYARYISVNTIRSCVSKAIIENSIELVGQEVMINYQFIGYSVNKNIKGVYNENSLVCCNTQLLEKLDLKVVEMLKDKEYVSFYSLTENSLLNIINNNVLSEESKIIFNLQSNDQTNINEIVKALAKTKCRLIISSEHLRKISLECLKKYVNVIVGFNEVDSSNEFKELLETFKLFNNKYYLFNNSADVRISKKTIDLNSIK